MEAGTLEKGPYDAIILAVPHREYAALTPENIMTSLKPNGIFYDIKSIMNPQPFIDQGFTYRSL
jgi:UDP-N-acetyl-D-galactosamine dehydrogenase